MVKLVKGEPIKEFFKETFIFYLFFEKVLGGTPNSLWNGR